MIIPFDMIQPDTLRNLIEDYVSREGTDNGYDVSLESKVNQIFLKLQAGDVVVVYDSASESTNIVKKDAAIAVEAANDTLD